MNSNIQDQIDIPSLESTNNQSINIEDTTVNQNPLNIDDISKYPSNKSGKIGLTKECVVDTLYLLSHIAFASILVVCLKNINPVLLFVLLMIIMGYISYDEQKRIPYYTLFIIGGLIYSFDLFITGNPKNSLKKSSILHTLKTTVWKLPYYSILSYYIILYAIYTFSLEKL